MNTITRISTEFPYSPNYQLVLGSNMHYIEQGEGDPIVFIHGIPTWSYLWRNIIPYVANDARAIAVDLIGFGKSDKPDITYSLAEHVDYFTEFMQQLNLQRVTLVMHGWGSIIGLTYAMRYPDKIKGLVMYESHFRPPAHWEMLSLPIQQLSSVIDDESLDYDRIVNTDFFMDKIFPAGMLRTLSDEEIAFYKQPFSTPESRKPIWQYLLEVPLGEEKNSALDLIAEFSEKLIISKIPKLLMFAVPGFVTTMESVTWAKANLSNLTLVDLGDGLHYVQESNPDLMGEEIRKWYIAISHQTAKSV